MFNSRTPGKTPFETPRNVVNLYMEGNTLLTNSMKVFQEVSLFFVPQDIFKIKTNADGLSR